MQYLNNAAITLVHFVVGMYLAIVMIRFLMQLVKADFYNPLSQAVVKLTNPPLRLLRRFIPGFAGIDWPSIILLFAVQAIEIILLTVLFTGLFPAPLGLLVLTIGKLIQLAIWIYIFMIFVTVIISWVNPGAYNPATVIIYQLTNPLMSQIRKVIPTTSGLDFSPMAALLLLYLSLQLIVAPIMDIGNHLTALPFRF